MDAGGRAMHGAIAEDRHPKGEWSNQYNLLIYYFVSFVLFVNLLRFLGIYAPFRSTFREFYCEAKDAPRIIIRFCN